MIVNLIILFVGYLLVLGIGKWIVGGYRNQDGSLKWGKALLANIIAVVIIIIIYFVALVNAMY